jgi:general secretion pathway protein J
LNPSARSKENRVKRPRDSAGFTLIELIVTFTILSLVLVMILGALRLGATSWERGEALAEQYQKKRIVFDLLSRQVKSAYPYRVKAKRAESDYLAFAGTSDSLRFVSTFSLRAKRSEGLVVATYRLEEGTSQGITLKIHEKRLLNKDFMEEEPKEDEFFTVLEDLRDAKFEYFEEGEEAEGEWVESWDGKEKRTLPRQVRVVAQWEGKREGEESVFSTHIVLPAYRYDERVISSSRGRLRPVRPR